MGRQGYGRPRAWLIDRAKAPHPNPSPRKRGEGGCRDSGGRVRGYWPRVLAVRYPRMKPSISSEAQAMA